MNFTSCVLEPIDENAAAIISEWEYPIPYNIYNFKGHPNGYLLNKKTWGIEQFCLLNQSMVIGYVSCQFDSDVLWVGWAFSPELCGKNIGSLFISECINEIRRVKSYKGDLFLRVAYWNKRAIKAYQKAGFTYFETIKDEIAYTDHLEDFWVMKQQI